MSFLFKIERYSHFIKIQNPPHSIEQLLVGFAYLYSIKGFVSVPGQGQVLKPTKVFAARTADKSEYRFHINQFSHLMQYLSNHGINERLVEVIDIPIPEPEYIDLRLNPGWVAKDYQEEIVEYLASKDDARIKLLEIQTGKGKGFSCIAAIAKLGQRVCFVLLPTYIEKWCKELTEVLNIDSKEIMVVQGSKHLRGLISLAQEGAFNSKITIISSRTLQNFITAYEDRTDEDYNITPEELFPLLKVGILGIDETHQHIHAMFKTMLYTHVKRVIGLTATLMSDDRTMEKVHKVMYPLDIRFNNLEFDRYIDVYAMSYSMENPYQHKLRTQEWGSNLYSHGAYEKSILRNPHYTQNFMKIIEYIVKIGYHDIKEQGDKLIIFAATIAMCEQIVKYLKRVYPQYDIRRYCEQDPYENVIDSDIRVTTIISAGTAIDIPGLRTAIMTNSISSSTANLQAVGRLRKRTDRPDVRFYYLYNETIKKQVDYHQKKKELLRPKTRSIKDFHHPYKL